MVAIRARFYHNLHILRRVCIGCRNVLQRSGRRSVISVYLSMRRILDQNTWTSYLVIIWYSTELLNSALSGMGKDVNAFLDFFGPKWNCLWRGMLVFHRIAKWRRSDAKRLSWRKVTNMQWWKDQLGDMSHGYHVYCTKLQFWDT